MNLRRNEVGIRAWLASRQMILTQMFMVVVGLGTIGIGFEKNFRIGIDTQENKCVPYTIFLININERELVVGNMYAFASDSRHQPFFRPGTPLVKILMGAAGDKVRIEQNYSTVDGKKLRNGLPQILINNEVVGEGLPYTSMPDSPINAPVEAFLGEKTLVEGEYWFMGTLPYSFDSRYWGTVKEKQVIGRAYPLV